ncbi:hypothetical protein DUNSADRAFT_10245 [Dunaliella salina]|uniref:Encoded protein n=1 Tax=Dunaliella salina TaxID=3046 RepID=A0ABQ7GFS9_DUNSA|nr:hypothetical protein DUNSADRAFT_10245 [Dunaliella salina]|eukprot:KAF5833455.1 hypothetical protein DUNSADRAFT_10245 [Dunaliella salina]
MAKLLGAAVSTRPAQPPRLPSVSTPIQGSSTSSTGDRPVHKTGRGLAALRPAPLEDESVPQLHASLGASGGLFGGAPKQGFDDSAGGPPNQTSPSQAREACADGSRGGDVFSSHQPCSVQEMVEQLLQENAKLLQRLG